jgi:hypothetical protein
MAFLFIGTDHVGTKRGISSPRMLDFHYLRGHNARPSRREIYAETTYIERGTGREAASTQREPGVVSPETR